MNSEDDIPAISKSFESIKHTGGEGQEFWFGRELAPILGYTRWDTFSGVISKAALAAASSGAAVENHFSEVRKLVSIGYGNDREIIDYALTRYACYLIAQNSDPRKPAVAAAQTYFAVQTRKQEVAAKTIEELKRVQARERLGETEKKFSSTLHAPSIDGKGIAEIRSSGDQVLFGGYSTGQMKSRFGITSAKPLADFLPTVSLRAKDLATEMTSVRVTERDLKGKPSIKSELDQNNRSVRKALLERGIRPEVLPPEEDIKKVERRIKKTTKELEG